MFFPILLLLLSMLKLGLTELSHNDVTFSVTNIFDDSPPTQPTNVTLNADYLYHVLWVDQLITKNYITVCTESDDTLELLISGNSPLLDNYRLYDYNGYYNYVGTLRSHSANDTKWPRSIISKSNCFTILHNRYNSEKARTNLLFRRKIQQRQNCIGDNIFSAPSPQVNLTLTASTTNKKPCEIIVLSHFFSIPFIRIGSFGLTTADDVYVFKTAMNRNFLMSINNTDTPEWRDILIFTNALSITFTNYINVTFVNSLRNIYKDDGIYQRGIMASPGYSGLSIDMLHPLYELIASNSTIASFNVKSLNEVCQITVNGYLGDGIDHKFSPNEKFSAIGEGFFIEDCGYVTGTGFLIDYSLTSVHKYTVINLTSSNPTYVYWLDDLKPLDAITVCLPNIDDTLQMFITQSLNATALNEYFLYDSKQIDTFVGTLGSSNLFNTTLNSPRQISSSSGCLTLQNQQNSATMYATLFFRMKKIHSKNCNSMNVFEVQQQSATISAYASDFGNCDVIILTSNSQNPTIPINSFEDTTYSSYDLKSGINQMSLAVIDKSKGNLWKNFKIFTPALCITLPSSQHLSLQLDPYSNVNHYVKNATDGQKGIIVSPTYTGFYKPYTNTLFTFDANTCQVQSQKCGINFKVNSLSEYNSIICTDGDGNNRKLDSNENLTVFSNIVRVDYVQYPTDANLNSSFLITYTIVTTSSDESSAASNFLSLKPLLISVVITFIKKVSHL